MGKLLYKTYVNNTSNSTANGKTYGRIVYTEILNTRKLAEHIADHGSVYTVDLAMGFIEKMRKCIIELCLDSKKVKLDGMGTFCLRSRSQGKHVGEVDETTGRPIAFTADDITGLRLAFSADQSNDYAMSSKELRAKASMKYAGSLLGTNQAASGGSGDDTNTNGGEG